MILASPLKCVIAGFNCTVLKEFGKFGPNFEKFEGEKKSNYPGPNRYLLDLRREGWLAGLLMFFSTQGNRNS